MASQCNGTTQYLSTASAPVTAVPLTLAIRFKKDANAAFKIALIVEDTGADFNWFYIGARDSGTGQTGVAVTQDAGGTRVAVSPNTYTVGAWHSLVGVFASATSRTVYLDDQSGSDTASATPAGLDTTYIGVRNRVGVFGNHWDGALAEAAIWNVALTAAEATTYSKGASPLMVRPNALVTYAPLMGVASPEINLRSATATFTVTGATKSAHPRIFYPNRQIVIPVPDVAAATPDVSAWAGEFAELLERRKLLLGDWRLRELVEAAATTPDVSAWGGGFDRGRLSYAALAATWQDVAPTVNAVSLVGVTARFFALARRTWWSALHADFAALARRTYRTEGYGMSLTFSGDASLKQAKAERKTYGIDVTPYLPSGVTISSATSTLKNPSGVEAASTVGPSTAGNIVTATVTGTEINATGTWELVIKVTLSNSETPFYRFVIEVDF